MKINSVATLSKTFLDTPSLKTKSRMVEDTMPDTVQLVVPLLWYPCGWHWGIQVDANALLEPQLCPSPVFLPIVNLSSSGTAGLFHLLKR